jgi:hypothetical protein
MINSDGIEQLQGIEQSHELLKEFCLDKKKAV